MERMETVPWRTYSNSRQMRRPVLVTADQPDLG